MLNVQNIAEFMHLVNGMKETIEVLEAYGTKAHWNNSKEQTERAEIALFMALNALPTTTANRKGA